MLEEYNSEDENMALKLKEKQSVRIRYRFEYMDCEHSEWSEIFERDVNNTEEWQKQEVLSILGELEQVCKKEYGLCQV